MAETFFPVEIQKFKNSLKEISFDVYLKLSENNFAHVFSKSTGIDYKRLVYYIQKGIDYLYIRSADQKLYEEYSKSSPDKILLDPNVSDSKKVSVLLNMADQNIQELFNIVKVHQDVASTSVKIVKNFITLLSQNPRSLATLVKTASHGDYLYYHSISVAVISLFLAKAAGLKDPKILEICGVGGFLHDIGLTLLPQEIVDSPTEFNAAQWRKMRLHPKLGVRMLETTPNVPDEVQYIILQHHESPDGLGYPNGLRGQVIFYPAKIVSIADSFCALITKRPYREAFNVEQALSIIQSESGKFDVELVQTLVSIFQEQKRIAA